MLPANYILAVTISVSVRVRLSVRTRRQHSNRKTRFVPKTHAIFFMNSDRVNAENNETTKIPPQLSNPKNGFWVNCVSSVFI